MSHVVNPCCIVSIKATADLPVKRFVGVDGALCAAGAQPIGVNINVTASGEEAAVILCGVAVVQTAGAITAGQRVKSAADGKVAAAPDVAGVIDPAHCGVALETASGADKYIRIRCSC